MENIKFKAIRFHSSPVVNFSRQTAIEDPWHPDIPKGTDSPPTGREPEEIQFPRFLGDYLCGRSFITGTSQYTTQGDHP